jgi:hypothetical protein
MRSARPAIARPAPALGNAERPSHRAGEPGTGGEFAASGELRGSCAAGPNVSTAAAVLGSSIVHAMPQSRCPRSDCNGNRFEVVAGQEPMNSRFKLSFVQCTTCGAVAGVMENNNIGSLITQIATRLGVTLS